MIIHSITFFVPGRYQNINIINLFDTFYMEYYNDFIMGCFGRDIDFSTDTNLLFCKDFYHLQKYPIAIVHGLANT